MSQPQQQSEKSFNYYVSDGGDTYHTAVHGGLTPLGIEFIARRRNTKISRIIKNPDQLLEYGVGLGWNISKSTARNKVGYDVATTLEQQVTNSGIQFKTEISESDNGRYDAILCSHVLEHMPHPVEGLKEIHRCLKNNGTALIYIPLERHYFDKSFKSSDPYQHVFTWSMQNFYNLTTSLGFKVISASRRKFGYERFIAQLVQKYTKSYAIYQLLLWLALLIRPDYELEFVLTKE